MDKEEIFQIVQACVAESLAVGKEEITAGSRLIDDLGADSLDFLDIIFALEGQFSIKLRDPNLDLLIRADFSQDRSSDTGALSADTFQRLSEWLPALREVKNPEQLGIRNLYSYITMDTLVHLVEKKLQEK